MKKNTIIISAVSVLLIITGVFGGAVYAQTPTPVKPGNIFSELVDFISQKLGLKKEQVQSVVNEFQTQKKQQRLQNTQDREQNRFNGLVQSGKITEAQKTAILNKLTEMRNKYNLVNLKDGTPESRKAQMDSMQTELKTWAQSQGINSTLIMPGFGGMGVGRGKFGGKWNGNSK